LKTKARLSITEAASYFATKKEGGTFEEIRKLLQDDTSETLVRNFDWETGLETGMTAKSDMTEGGWIFSKCL